MAFGALLQLLVGKARGLPLTHGIFASTSLCLFVVFLLSPQITQAIFQAFQCVPFEWSPTVTHYYMRSSLAVRCYTSDHDHILLISYVLMLVWPIGSVLLFFSLVHRARSRLIEHTRDEYVVSIRLLHNDYKPESYFWASVELVHRSTLIGWVLLIDEEKSFVRLVLANIICVIMLMWTSITLPYVRMHDNVLAIAAALLLQLTYIWSSYVKVYHALAEYENPEDDKRISSRVLGFESSNELTVTLLFLGGSLLGIFLTLWTHRLQAQKWGHHIWLKDVGVAPEMSLSMGKRWMLFISHLTISSASIDWKIISTQADHAKGGAPLRYLCDHECPRDLVEVIFGDDGKIIQWHRRIEFQLLSLKKIAEAALLASPAYSHKKSLPLSVHGEVALGVKQRASNAVYVYASPNNADARALARELQEGHLSNLFIAEEMPVEADLGAARAKVLYFLYLSKDTFAGNSGMR
ncbi:hypothetical protein AB1Y20_016373 [Prymnesium parvum]|uniref:TIR domain-containing protein n=1 Tax=Prymnesium parvum TaxID=97485 RepID=A0AB34IF32_PRYPA